jgi:hypothetical protein
VSRLVVLFDVGSGDPLINIVKVPYSTELCVLCRVARHLVNLPSLCVVDMFEYVAASPCSMTSAAALIVELSAVVCMLPSLSSP